MVILIMPIVAMSNGDYVFMLMFPIVVIGVFMNRYVMNANMLDQQARMPAKIIEQNASFVEKRRDYISIDEKVRSSWLADRHLISIGKKWWLVSVGDLFVFAGHSLAWIYITLLIFRGMTQ